MVNERKQLKKQISVCLPTILVDEIDIVCAANMLSRSYYLFHAVREKLERDRERQAKSLVTSLRALKKEEK